jgi:hypothetical protein
LTPVQFHKFFESELNKIKHYTLENFPRHIGKIAVDYHRQYFINGGNVDDVLQPWKPFESIGLVNSAETGFGALLSLCCAQYLKPARHRLDNCGAGWDTIQKQFKQLLHFRPRLLNSL